jgi:hypothetical protein
MFSYYFLFGFFLAILTVWDNGIEIALGIHAINNVFSALTVTYDDSVLQLDALWIMEDNFIGWGSVALYFLLFSLVLYAYYKWRFFSPGFRPKT